MAQHQILEGVEKVRLYIGDVGIFREHQRQLLLVHQYAGRDRRDDVVTVGNGLLKNGNICVLHFFNFVQVTQFQLRHAAALGILQYFYRNIVVVKHCDQVFHHLRLVVVAITSDVNRDLACGSFGCRHRGVVAHGAR